MSEAENIQKLVNILSRVPAKKLRIIQLANEIPVENGAFDPDVLRERQTEIRLAIEEANVYSAKNINVCQAVANVKGVNE